MTKVLAYPINLIDKFVTNVTKTLSEIHEEKNVTVPMIKQILR